MTKSRINRLKEKISLSRGRLFKSNPFFAILLMHMRFVADTNINTISTNGRCIYFNPNFIDKLYTYEIDYILCHQIMHIVQGDIWRERDLANINYHHACDIVLNANLRMFGFNRDKYPHFGNILFKPLLGEIENVKFTALNCYTRRMYNISSFDERTQRKFVFDEDTWWDWKKDIGLNGTIIIEGESSKPFGKLKIIDSKNKPEKEEIVWPYGESSKTGTNEDNSDSGSVPTVIDYSSAELKAQWDSMIAVAEKFVQNMKNEKEIDAVSITSEHIMRKIKELKKAQTDWRKILNEFVQEEVSDYSFSPPDRRFQDNIFFLPDYNETETVVKDILFMIDTSGSVNNDTLTMVYSEICGAIEQFNGKFRGMLGFFDTEVYPLLPFDNIADVVKAVPIGGGGTDFRPIFDMVKNTYQSNELSCIIIFSDGIGYYPEKSDIDNTPVLWVIDNQQVIPPFGKIARLRRNADC